MSNLKSNLIYTSPPPASASGSSRISLPARLQPLPPDAHTSERPRTPSVSASGPGNRPLRTGWVHCRSIIHIKVINRVKNIISLPIMIKKYILGPQVCLILLFIKMKQENKDILIDTKIVMKIGQNLA